MSAEIKRPLNFALASPYITLKNIDAVVDFYVNAFGFKKKELVPGDDGTIWHAEMLYHDQVIMFGKQGAYGANKLTPNTTKTPCPINLYIYCSDVDKFYQQAIAAGAESVTAPEDTFWGDRMCCLKDPDGYEWVFATKVKACGQS